MCSLPIFSRTQIANTPVLRVAVSNTVVVRLGPYVIYYEERKRKDLLASDLEGQRHGEPYTHRNAMSRPVHSTLEDYRRSFAPRLPSVLKGAFASESGEALGAMGDKDKIKELFPKTYGKASVNFVAAAKDDAASRPIRVGVVLSGGQAPGGHNVIAGIFDFVKRFHKDSVMIGFLNGPHGIFTGNYMEITDAIMDRYGNMGGFEIIG